MKEENKKRINKLVIPFTRRTLSFLTATTMIVTGTTGCKETDNNENTSSIIISDDLISSEENIIVDTEDTITSEITSKEVTTESEQNNISSNVSSEDKNNNPVVSNNENTTSTPSVSTPTIEPPEKPVDKPTQTPSVPSTPEVTMPAKLTAENINNIEVFKHFAAKLKEEVGESLFIDGDKFIDTEIGTQVTLAVLNQQYLTAETMMSLFGNLSLEEFQSGGDFIVVMISQMLTDGKKYSYNNFCLDKNIGNYLVEVQNVFIKDNQQEMAEVLRNFYLKDNLVKYETHFWVDNYVRRLFNMTIDFNNLKDPELSKAFINSSSSITEYSNKITNIYNNFHSKVKIIN